MSTYPDVPTARWRQRVMFMMDMLQAYRVEGGSMRPVLNDGDVVLINPRREPAAGDIVLAEHPFKKSVLMIKRVASTSNDNKFELIGDSPSESTDSRTLGLVLRGNIRGCVVCRLS